MTGCLDFVHRPVRKLDVFSSSDDGRATPTLLGPLERANLSGWTRVGVSLPSPEDGNTSSFRNAGLRAFRIPDVGQSTETQ
jgi:hypothetical protein